MKENKDLFPLGSVVYLKEGTTKMVIIGRSMLLSMSGEDKQGKPVLFDYSSVMYPMGYTGEEKVFFFNHEDIDKIEFKGFSDSENEQYLKNMRDYQKQNNDTFIREDVAQFLENH